METNVTFSQTCRLCSTYFKQGVLIFSEEGRRLYLQVKIRKYLFITVSMEDRLPKTVCNECCRKLDNIHKFATMAHRNQDKLNKMIIDTVNYTSMDQKQTENKGLLHTYLTKGVIDKPNEDMEEVEVKVDPMLFLQCNLEEELSGDDEENLANILDTDQTANYKEQEAKVDENCTIKDFECSLCKRRFYSDFALENHAWSHISKNRRVVLNSQNNFYIKIENRHDDCSDENKANISEIKSTINENYDGEAAENGHGIRFACPICGKIISTKGNLKVHLETHRPKGKYGCDICGRIFKTQCNLHRHKEYHTGIQFTCAVCGRVYPTNSTLRAHSITHSDLRPHKCPLCDKTFKRNQDLKFHINQHTGARPYKCPYCPKAFASSGNCFSHRKRMHPLEVERDRDLAAKIMR